VFWWVIIGFGEGLHLGTHTQSLIFGHPHSTQRVWVQDLLFADYRLWGGGGLIFGLGVGG